ncbi:hypothetical protein GUJ93_ZPchr0003g17935 [Zizania palustris]|uniref:Peptidase A1 domain-containing protein n=1 Tax=Zizania palustris TaxID=103762 RepID=A0A8J5SRX2_ZIZPA|nr:hypothetical protein GUJ93_ZPchr0003g17935 [Zizania palustris]
MKLLEAMDNLHTKAILNADSQHDTIDFYHHTSENLNRENAELRRQVFLLSSSPPASPASIPPPPPTSATSTASAASARLPGLPPPPPASTASAASAHLHGLRRLHGLPPPPPTSAASARLHGLPPPQPPAASRRLRRLPPPPPASRRLRPPPQPPRPPAASSHLHGLRRLHGLPLPPPPPPPPAASARLPVLHPRPPPNTTFLVALDTGSDLFWVPCDCKQCSPITNITAQGGPDLRPYSPAQSSTSKTVTRERGAVAGAAVKAPIVFGCGQVQTGAFLEGAAMDGLMGLGMDKVSMPSILASSGLVKSDSFSMCFSRDGVGRINFGDTGSRDQAETPFIVRSTHPTYNISVTSMDVGSNSLPVGFSAVVDSGTSFTYQYLISVLIFLKKTAADCLSLFQQKLVDVW